MVGLRSCPDCGAQEGAYHLNFCPRNKSSEQESLQAMMQPKSAENLQFKLPPEVEQYRHDIRRFVEAMIYKLSVHSSKGKWEKYNITETVGKLQGEVVELQEAVLRGNMVEILLEGADVANYALIASAIAMERGK